MPTPTARTRSTGHTHAHRPPTPTARSTRRAEYEEEMGMSEAARAKLVKEINLMEGEQWRMEALQRTREVRSIASRTGVLAARALSLPLPLPPPHSLHLARRWSR